MQRGKKIIDNFCIDDEIIEIKPYGCGHINDTYLVTCKKSKYVIQRINHLIFKKPWEVMENIINICDHLKSKVMLYGGNPDRETLTFITAKDGSYRTGNVKFNVRKRTASKTVKRKRTVFYRCRIIKIG